MRFTSEYLIAFVCQKVQKLYLNGENIHGTAKLFSTTRWSIAGIIARLFYGLIEFKSIIKRIGYH